jgi:predicted RNA-binding protein (virulence factor B family)
MMRFVGAILGIVRLVVLFARVVVVLDHRHNRAQDRAARLLNLQLGLNQLLTADRVVAHNQQHAVHGFCDLSDKSPSELIADRFKVSKKAYKKAIGDLYRRRLITISDEGIKLV